MALSCAPLRYSVRTMNLCKPYEFRKPKLDRVLGATVTGFYGHRFNIKLPTLNPSRLIVEVHYNRIELLPRLYDNSHKITA